MGLNTELWLSTYQEQLYKNDDFLGKVGIDHSAYVNNKTVHVPQAGSNPTISKNLTVFPAAIGSRTDVDLSYDMNLYYSQPIRVGVDETQFLNPDKRASVLMQHTKKMKNVIGNNTLYSWAGSGAATQVRTTGSASGTALAPGATGTRKVPVLTDFFDARSILDAQDLNPSDTVYCIIPTAMYWQMLKDTNISKQLEWGASAVAPSGKVPMIAGMQILTRSSVTVFDNTATPVIKTVGDEGTPSTTATTDNMAISIISESYVSKANGAIQIYTKDNDPSMYGDVISAVVCQGASKLRTNQEGIVQLIQTWVS